MEKIRLSGSDSFNSLMTKRLAECKICIANRLARWHEQSRKKKNGLSVVGKGEGRDGPQDEANI